MFAASSQPSVVQPMVIGAGVGAMIGGWVAKNAREKNRYDIAFIAVVGCMIAGAFGGCLLAARRVPTLPRRVHPGQRPQVPAVRPAGAA